MKIAVNTRLLVKNKLEGIGWFTFENLKRICQQHPEHEFFFIFDRKYDPGFIFSDNIKPLVIGPQARHPFLYYLWFGYSIPYILKKIKADLFLSPDGYLSLGMKKIPQLAVFHDLNFEHYPEDLPFLERKNYKHFFPKYARHATRIATVSEYSKSDIVEQYQIEADKIDVVYNGANEAFEPIPEQLQTQVREKYTQGKPYFVFVGALHPRKNLVNLFKAFDVFKKASDNPVKLLIVGEKKWWTEKIETAYNQMQHKNAVCFSGRLSAENLHKVLASALALTYVSYFEGFGIPIIEAYRCHVPVITSNVTSMPEIAGDAALIIDPFDINSIADAMSEIYTKPGLRQQLIEKGKIRMQEFTWQKSADRLWSSILKTVKK
jgi:glycosyltransferase involved in cell wall biosynthesis